MTRPTIRDLLTQASARTSDRLGMVDPVADETLTFAEWDDRASRAAAGLDALGLDPGDHLVLAMADAVEFPVLLFGALELGLVVTPSSYRAPADRLAYILEDAGADALAFDDHTSKAVGDVDDGVLPSATIGVGDVGGPKTTEYAALLDGDGSPPTVAVDEDDLALLLYTSGTTGQPKGVCHTHRNVIQADLLALPYNRLRSSDTALALGPLYHVGPLLANFMPALHVGATNLIQRDFDPARTLTHVAEWGISALWGVPTHFSDILATDAIETTNTDGVRLIQYSGAAMPEAVVTECRQHFPDVDFVNAYGTTEIIVAAFLFPEAHDDHLGSIGRAVPSAEVRLVDPDDPHPNNVVPTGEEGELFVDTPTCMTGYWNDPDRTAETIVDGWYRTGDLGRCDGDGYLYYVDRTDNMIVSGGENIYPAEVEDALQAHPGVRNAAVVGRPDPNLGEAVTAVVVRADDAVTADDLDAFVRESSALENFKRPRTYDFRSALPRTQSDKIARDELADEVAEAAEVEDV